MIIVATILICFLFAGTELCAGAWKVSELESVRIHVLPILEEIGKCQNWKVF